MVESINILKREKRGKFEMAAFREQVNQDSCVACFSATKYSCITCDQPICNRCSKYELNEEKCGWEAGKHVAYENHVGTNRESKLAVKNNCQGIYTRQHIPIGLSFIFTNISRTYLRVSFKLYSSIGS